MPGMSYVYEEQPGSKIKRRMCRGAVVGLTLATGAVAAAPAVAAHKPGFKKPMPGQIQHYGPRSAV